MEPVTDFKQPVTTNVKQQVASPVTNLKQPVTATKKKISGSGYVNGAIFFISLIAWIVASFRAKTCKKNCEKKKKLAKNLLIWLVFLVCIYVLLSATNTLYDSFFLFEFGQIFFEGMGKLLIFLGEGFVKIFEALAGDD